MASYYNDEDDGQWELDGEITWDTFTTPTAYSQVESYIAFNTGTNSPAPGVNGTFWSAIWEGTLHVPQDGNYIFRFKNLDDGARLYVDDIDTPLLESWLVQGFHNYESVPVALNAGLHDFRVEFAQGPGFGGGLIVEWDLENVFCEKIGPYSDATPPPTSTPTITPSPTPVPTDTPVPSDTPMPTDTPVPTNTPGSEPTSPPPWWAPAENVLMKDEPTEKREAFSELLSQIRDQVLRSSPKGDAYIEKIYRHAPEIMKLLAQDEDLRQQVKKLALEVQPLLEATVNNEAKGKKLSLEKAWVDEAIKILSIVEKQASPELREEIQWWQKHLPDFAGKREKKFGRCYLSATNN